MTGTAVTHGARAQAELDTSDGWRLRLTGRWTTAHVAQADQTLKSLPLPDGGKAIFHMGDVELLDTAGAWLIHRTESALLERGVTVHLNDTAPRFDANVPAASDTMDAIIAAFDDALGTALKRLVGWTLQTGQANRH